MNDTPSLSAAQVAERLGLTTTRNVLAWIAAGDLVAVNVSAGRSRATWRVSEREYERFISRRQQPRPAPRSTRGRKLSGVTKYF